MILNINESIGKETVDKLIDAMNNLEQGEKLFIYLFSEGGCMASEEAMVHIMNNNIDRIELVGYGDLMSAGFGIFFRYDGYKILLPGTLGMFHQTRMEMDTISEFNNPDQMRYKADKEWMKLQREHTINFCNSLKMTSKEISDIKKGKDVYFQYHRMQEFLKAQEK